MNTPNHASDDQIAALSGDSMSPEGRRLFDFGRALMRAQAETILGNKPFGIDLTKHPSLKPVWTQTPAGVMCICENQYDGPESGVVGWGSTKLEALADLVEKLEG